MVEPGNDVANQADRRIVPRTFRVTRQPPYDPTTPEHGSMSKDPQAPPLPAGDPQRSRIASIAARLMAEDGIDSFSTAKRKAALSLGLPENARLPDDTEVEAELRLYQRLFQDEEQTKRIAYLRQKALDFMAIVQSFNPYLTGSVLDGTAGRYAEIDLQLFTDSAKDVEIFLLNRQIDYEHSTPRSDRAEAVLTVHDDDTDINLIVYPSNDERVSFKTRDGKTRPRARIAAVQKLLDNSGT